MEKKNTHRKITLENIRPYSGTESPSPTLLENIRHHGYIRMIRSATRHTNDINLSTELVMSMIQTQREIDTMRLFDLSPTEIQQRIEESVVFQGLKSQVRTLGIARMMLYGDWSVNRKQEISENMSVVPLPQLMNMIAQFYKECAPKDSQQQLRAVDLGCGNGEFCSELRTDPLNQTNQWEIFGYADYIYFTLNDFLKNLLNIKFRDDKGLKEFLDVISTLLIRKIHYSHAYLGRKSSRETLLQSLPDDLNIIRQILPCLEDYIKLKGRDRLKVDLEFLSDADRLISPEAQVLIKEYCDSPGAFVDKYFKSEIKDLSNKEKARLEAINSEILKIRSSREHDLRTITLEIKKPLARQPNPTRDTLIKLQSKREKENTLRQLHQEREEILEKIPDLSKFTSFYPYNVIPGKFDEFREVFPESSIRFGWSFRATSHLDDASYAQTMKIVALTLAPGGVFLDDGKRESWTRFERISSFESLQKELGPEYRIRIISSGQNAKAILVERGIVQDDGCIEFFSDHYDKKMLKCDVRFVEVDEWKTKLPQMFIRNQIIAVIRGLIVKETPEGLKGRMNFKDVHKVIEEELSKVFTGEAWEFLLEVKETASTEVLELAGSIAERVIDVLRANPELNMRNLLEEKIVPLSEGIVQTFARSSLPQETNAYIQTPRVFPVACLPRNRDLPSPERIKDRFFELTRTLIELKEYTNSPPIRIIEFDDCFTNSLLVKALGDILEDAGFAYGVGFDELVSVTNVSLRDGKFPNIKEDKSSIFIIGGSVDNASDKNGQAFSDRFCGPLLSDVSRGASKRVLGICFGSQVVLQAFGKMKHIKFKTLPGALQYGAFPIAFIDENHKILKDLSGGVHTVGMTRESYSIVDGYKDLGFEMQALAYETMYQNGRLVVNTGLPNAFSILDDRVVTTQFHPEIQLRKIDISHPLNGWLTENHDRIRKGFKQGYAQEAGSTINRPLDLFRQQFNIQGQGKDGPVSWVEQDVGPIFLVNTLLTQVKSLLT